MKKVILFLVLIVAVVGISGCTNSISQTNKHFDNGIVAFDYPSNMEVVDSTTGTKLNIKINDNNQGPNRKLMVQISTIPIYVGNFETSMKNSTLNPYITNLSPFTISGRNAYNMTEDSSGTIYYNTAIDYGNAFISINPTRLASAKDQKETDYYKTYQVIVNSFQVK